MVKQRLSTQSAPFLSCLAIAAGALGILASTAPLVAGVAAIALLLLVWLVRQPVALVPITIVLATTAFPAAVPRAVSIGPLGIYLYEPFLALALCWSIATIRGLDKRDIPAILLLVGLAASVVAGAVSGNPTAQALNDARGPLVMVLSYLIAARIIEQPTARRYALIALGVSLWVSTIMILLASLGWLELSGRTEDASLVEAGSSGNVATGAARFLTSATHSALAVLCVLFALLVLRKITAQQSLPCLVPAAIITFLSFSRNSLLALLTVAVVILMLRRTTRTAVALFTRTTGVAILVGIALIATNVFSGLSAFDFLHTQFQAYSHRVLEGLDGQTLERDTSVLYRESENSYLREAIAESPVVGHGMGYPYRPASGEPGSFFATSARYYAHDFFLWMLVKTGVVGIILLAAFLYVPLRGTAGVKRNRPAVAFVATSIALLAVSSVAPMPLGFESAAALVIGTILGATTGLASGRPSKIRESHSQPVRAVRNRQPGPRSGGNNHNGRPCDARHVGAEISN
ncbi:O-antigen ligase family protein [Pseudonocardia lutea]|uniref:O-antigen ligase family protein n=1 Tax=Pseudonocardia lutea TaxID=2172015 RepID=A0ABW1I2T0_9PSEU